MTTKDADGVKEDVPESLDGKKAGMIQTEVQEVQAAVQEGQTLARRLFCKVLGAMGVTVLADAISGGRVLGGGEGEDHDSVSEDTHDDPSAEVSAKLDEVAEEIAARVEAESPDLSEREKAMRVVDYIGCALFAWGVKDLLPGGHGHIHAAHYGALLALTSIKYELSDQEGKHHLEEETESNAKAFGIIAGTIVVAEGLDMDVEKAYEDAMSGAKPSNQDRVALMTMLSSVLSPATTTVGSASIMRKMSNELCDGDPAMMAVCTSHISNLSGFLLFGDPPFIAVCEKYGFEKGIKWQFETMLPLALYSLVSATYKLNLILAKKDGLSGAGAHEKALADTFAGIKNNIPVLAKIIFKSLGNIAKYFTGVDLGVNAASSLGQNPGGIEVKIGEVIAEKLGNLARLPFDPEFDRSSHEKDEGMVHEDTKVVDGANEIIAGLIDELTRKKAEHVASEAPQDVESNDDDDDDGRIKKVHDLRDAISEKEYDEVTRLGTELGLSSIDVFVQTLRDFHDNQKVDDSLDHEQEPYGWREKLSPLAIYDRTTSIHRVKEAIGHNLGDVVNVFPFQAGCVPFLTTAFKDAADALDGLGETAKENVLFFLIMLFSSMADNYVACKIGLELFPNKPHIPLIAAIQGGSLTAIGNMANVSQFSLDQFPLLDSLKQFDMHMDAVAASTAYSNALSIMNNMGLMMPPKVLKGAGSEAQASAADHSASADQGVAMSRRSLLTAWRGREAA